MALGSALSQRLAFPAEPSADSQQTRDVDPMLAHCWPAVVDGGPAVNQHWVNISCLLGWSHRPAARTVLTGTVTRQLASSRPPACIMLSPWKYGNSLPAYLASRPARADIAMPISWIGVVHCSRRCSRNFYSGMKLVYLYALTNLCGPRMTLNT